MLVAAVTRVDQRALDLGGCCGGRALTGMAHGDDIRIALDHAGGVGHRFALGGAGGIGRRKTQHLAAQPEHCGFEAQAGAGAGFKKQGGQDLAVTFVGVGGGVVDDAVGQSKQLVDLGGGKIQRTDQFLHKVVPLCYYRSYSTPVGGH